MTEKISGGAFKQMVAFGAACITAQKQAINDLNVFPVPDGDTGTNMSLTIQTAVNELRKAEPATVDEAAKLTASGLLRGARGNSGVILSLLFRGMSKVLKGHDTADGALLAEAMQDKGQLVSGEFVPARVPLLQKAFDRCGITCAVAVENDAALHNTDWPRFDRVLCDVPCSGLGIIAKKPDIRYKDLDGIENLLATQQKILQNGADSLAENGRLVYSTCTVNVQENQAQVQKFLSANPDFRVVTPEITLSGVDVTPLGTVFLPHKTGTDGFFAAILERK